MLNLRLSQKAALLTCTLILAVLVIALPLYFVLFASRPRGAVTTNGFECAKIGARMLDRGGTAMDAAIAALLCEGVAMPQSMGLGGGFLMTVYHRATGRVEHLNARELAPENAFRDMMRGNATLATKGGLAVAVPAELRGYRAAYERYGRLPWAELVQPTIDLCRNGIEITDYLATTFAKQVDQIRKDKYLREEFIDPKTGEPWAEGKKMLRPRLAKTLTVIQNEPDAIHSGSLTGGLVHDIIMAGGLITMNDLKSYKPKWQTPVKVSLPNGDVLYSSPLPGSGVILALILNLAKNIIDFGQSIDSILNTQRIVESFKFGYGRRTELGDLPDDVEMQQLLRDLTSESYAKNLIPRISDNKTSQDPVYYGGKAIQPDDSGTAHLSVLSPNGDAVSVTSTINLYFGAGFMSKSTGIILNDQMDDFSSPGITNDFDIPPSENNYIAPGKHPLSSMCPSIVLDKNKNVRLILGAAGGTKITSSVALTTMKNLWFGFDLQEAVASIRYHHQLYPMSLQLEETFKTAKPEFVASMKKIGHDILFQPTNGFSALTGIAKIDNRVTMATDTRRLGQKVAVS